jgi:G3E family GTPase
VDTTLISRQNWPVEEVAGGCFCCSFPDLHESLLQLQNTIQPDIILAEPVGSCTDLVSTVLRPLATYYPGQFEVAPLTILLDASRDVASFPQTVGYLFDKQLTEAEFILLNKVDLLGTNTVRNWIESLQKRYPHAQTLAISSHTGEGVEVWLDMMLGQNSASPLNLDVDYGIYADAEAELGWLNAKGLVRDSQPFSPQTWTRNLLDYLTRALSNSHLPIAHVKVYVSTPETSFKASLTQTGIPISWDVTSEDVPADQLEFILNLRVNADPQQLEQVVQEALDAIKPHGSARHYFTQFECFRPLPPRPTHRLILPATS